MIIGQEDKVCQKTLMKRMHDARFALTGLASIQENLTSDDRKPEWWTAYHESAVWSTIQVIATELNYCVETLDAMKQAGVKLRPEDGGDA